MEMGFIKTNDFIQTNGNLGLLKRYPCGITSEFGNSFPRSFKLSKNFNLGNLLVGTYAPPKVKAQRGLQPKDIVCNLIQLAENCLEPVYSRYPDLIISSGLRDANSRSPDGRLIGAGDHSTGCAADLQFTNATLEDYVSIAHWCVKNIPFRQLLLEFNTYPNQKRIKTGWIHVALLLDGQGRLIQSTFPAVQTMLNGETYTVGLITLS